LEADTMSSRFAPRHDDYEGAVRASFARQGVLASWGATMDRVAPGRVDLALPFSARVTQQQGFFHGGVVATLGDSAGGYAAMTLLDAGLEIVSVEYKINFVAPAVGQRLLAFGTCLKAGRRLLVSEARVDVEEAGTRRLCAILLQTLAPVMPRLSGS
jgi:uncharacterized protein (TIGR00369 family)